eukprot:763161-Hanusia_phi.AAC.1
MARTSSPSSHPASCFARKNARGKQLTGTVVATSPTHHLKLRPDGEALKVELDKALHPSERSSRPWRSRGRHADRRLRKEGRTAAGGAGGAGGAGACEAKISAAKVWVERCDTKTRFLDRTFNFVDKEGDGAWQR